MSYTEYLRHNLFISTPQVIKCEVHALHNHSLTASCRAKDLAFLSLKCPHQEKGDTNRSISLGLREDSFIHSKTIY